jgi:crossover junction endodeoxyribonuclease RuvC
MISVMGVDLSLRSTGLCAIVSNRQMETTALKGLVPEGYRKMASPFYALAKAIRDYAEHYRIDKIFMEGYSLGSMGKSNSLTFLCEAGGLTKYLLYNGGCEIVIVSPGTLKKFITGKGNCAKAQVEVSLMEHYGLKFNTPDEADACVLAHMAWMYFNNYDVLDGKKSLRGQIQIIEKLRKENG